MPTIRPPVQLPANIFSVEDAVKRIGTVGATGVVAAATRGGFVGSILNRHRQLSTVRNSQGVLVQPTLENIQSLFGFVTRGSRTSGVFRREAKVFLRDVLGDFRQQTRIDRRADVALGDNARRRRAFLAGKPLIDQRNAQTRRPGDTNPGTLVRRKASPGATAVTIAGGSLGLGGAIGKVKFG